MSDVVVIIDISTIRPGKVAELRTAMSELADFVEEKEPRAIAYDVYIDFDDSAVTVLQVHPDSASAEFHMDIAADMFSQFRDLLTLEGIDVYGDASEALLDRLRHKCELLGGQRLVVHRRHAGFARTPPNLSP